MRRIEGGWALHGPGGARKEPRLDLPDGAEEPACIFLRRLKNGRE
jgi:hypothetical protein